MEIKEYDSILVVSPHADDESIGCGGLLAKYGKQSDVLLITDGRHGHTTEGYNDETVLIDLRKDEIKSVAKICNLRNLFFLNIEDQKVGENSCVVKKFDISPYTHIFVPNRYESHKDHNVLYAIFKSMKKKQKSSAKLYEYEVWTPIRYPSDYLDISGVIEMKREMIGQYKSQIADVDYVDKGIALSNYRGMASDFDFAEAFALSSSRQIKNEIFMNLPLWLKLRIYHGINRR
ncbi:hypothetical protein D3Z51_17585 [Clostridiaceae bacterium]|nr:hypothetical protein [Clostridiaceae bacterium]RKI09959.1 hypothetical protein D7V81_16680 [bacterium 1XD21-70]